MYGSGETISIPSTRDRPGRLLLLPDPDLFRLVGSEISSVDPSYGSKTVRDVFDLKMFTVFHLKVSISSFVFYTFFIRET